MHLVPVRRAVEHGRDLCADRRLRRVQRQRVDLGPIDRQHRPHHAIDAQHVGPAYLQVVALDERFDLRAGFRRRRRVAALTDILKDRQRHAENIHVFGQEQPVFIHVVTDPAQAAAYHLLAQQLTGEIYF